MSSLSGLNTTALIVKQGDSDTPFSSVIVSEPSYPIAETVIVRLGQVYPMDYYPYGTNQALGTLTDPTPTGQGYFNAATDTFTETIYAASYPAAAQALLQRLIYLPPPLTDGEGIVVSAAVEVNGSDGSQTSNPFSITNAYARQLDNVTAPGIAGTVANQPISAGGKIDPFTTVSLTDQNFLFVGTQNTSAIIEIDDGGKPTDADGILTGTGLSKSNVGTYTLASGNVSSVMSDLQALSFETNPGTVGTVQDTFKLSVTDPNAGLTNTDVSTSISIVGTPAPAPAPTNPTTPITPSTVGAPVFRFYEPSNDSHFWTTNAQEAQTLEEAGSGYNYEGIGFHAVDPTTDSSAEPVYRFYDDSTNSHFYTATLAEVHQIQATLPNYLLDGVAFYVDPTQQAGDVAMYRYYDTSGIGAGEHFYTDSAAEMASVAATRPDLVEEGPAFYVKA